MGFFFLMQLTYFYFWSFPLQPYSLTELLNYSHSESLIKSSEGSKSVKSTTTVTTTATKVDE